MPEWFWYVVSPIFFIGVGVFWLGKKRATMAAHQTEARNRGWDYRAWDLSLAKRFAGGPFDHWGWLRHAENVIEGEYRGRPLTAFEFTYLGKKWTGGAHTERTVVKRIEVVAVELTTSLPSFVLAKRGVLGRMERELAGISNGVGDQEFDTAFAVEPVDEAGRMLGDGVRAWLLHDDRTRTLPVLVRGTKLATWDERPLAFDEVQRRADFLNDLADQLVKAQR